MIRTTPRDATINYTTYLTELSDTKLLKVIRRSRRHMDGAYVVALYETLWTFFMEAAPRLEALKVICSFSDYFSSRSVATTLEHLKKLELCHPACMGLLGVATMKELSLSYDSIARPAIQDRLIEIMKSSGCRLQKFQLTYYQGSVMDVLTTLDKVKEVFPGDVVLEVEEDGEFDTIARLLWR
jgi:hypothetical protein